MSTERFAPAQVMMAVGLAAVVAGGLVAAVTGPLDLARGSWVSAYLVLVGGVAQGAMGYRNSHHADRLNRSIWTQLGSWNAGSAAVIVGTLTERTWVVDAGSVLLVVALALALSAERGSTRPDSSAVRRWLACYRALLLILAVSIPVGVVLSHVRHA